MVRKKWEDLQALGHRELIEEVLGSKKNKLTSRELGAWGERELMEYLMNN